jgi:hypothetical protein
MRDQFLGVTSIGRLTAAEISPAGSKRRGAPNSVSEPLVTVVTPTTGDPCVLRAIKSAAAQTYESIQHLVFIDNVEAPPRIKSIVRRHKVEVIELPCDG